MIRTFFIPLLAIAGVIFCVWTVVKASRPLPPNPPVIEPPQAPYRSFVAGSGMIEASTQNIGIGTPVAGVVKKLEVVVGDDVKAGDVLFEIDDRDLVAELRVKQAALAVAREQLAKLEAGTRPEELPPAEARLLEERSLLADANDQLERWRKINDPRAVSEEELSKRRFAVMAADARVKRAEADVALLRAGSWAPDIAVARAQVTSAQAGIEAVRTELDRRVVRAPVDGRILQANIRMGEFAQAGALSMPLMMMGSVTPLHVRVDIDEHDAWRVKAGAKATAFARGNKAIRAELGFVRFEPFVVPKRSLTGESTERVDTRVLQVLYSFDRGSLPLYVGQQMDIYIEAEPLDSIMDGGKKDAEAAPPETAGSQPSDRQSSER
ncbi:MAG: HlyD family efflux transporter periplasmic adaptor subunit [Phycisphaerales bacterium]|nr:HlyD family efflux transporter periplasmic adaptor subunit [Phycisphaerales bacterium]